MDSLLSAAGQIGVCQVKRMENFFCKTIFLQLSIVILDESAFLLGKGGECHGR